MRKIKDIISKPSEAIQAMIDGLIEQDQRADFEIDMGTWGNGGASFCYGCAATCTIQKIAGKNFTVDTINGREKRSEYMGIESEDIARFEFAVNAFRMNIRVPLFDYFKSLEPEIEDPNFCLEDRNWKSELPKVQAYCDQLKQLGL